MKKASVLISAFALCFTSDGMSKSFSDSSVYSLGVAGTCTFSRICLLAGKISDAQTPHQLFHLTKETRRLVKLLPNEDLSNDLKKTLRSMSTIFSTIKNSSTDRNECFLEERDSYYEDIKSIVSSLDPYYFENTIWLINIAAMPVSDEVFRTTAYNIPIGFSISLDIKVKGHEINTSYLAKGINGCAAQLLITAVDKYPRKAEHSLMKRVENDLISRTELMLDNYGIRPSLQVEIQEDKECLDQFRTKVSVTFGFKERSPKQNGRREKPCRYTEQKRVDIFEPMRRSASSL
ncbi:MAG: hypothetical protein LBJ71_02025 [Holosporaceae bacterium]|jgi:hypothetical protein|nr:hypothetical protein [Holosporaceae bacterium]